MKYEGIHRVSNANALIEAYEKARSGSDWKESVQKYEYDLWPNISETKRKLNEGAYRQKPFVEFDLRELGKCRHIKSIHISDRVIQRSVCDNVLDAGDGPIFDLRQRIESEGQGRQLYQEATGEASPRLLPEVRNE